MDDLGRFVANLSQIILVVSLHFTFYYTINWKKWLDAQDPEFSVAISSNRLNFIKKQAKNGRFSAKNEQKTGEKTGIFCFFFAPHSVTLHGSFKQFGTSQTTIMD